MLALYIESENVRILYRTPEVFWLCCPLLLYWISRMWIGARRGKIDDEGFVLWESHAIVRYLARKHGLGRLCPADARVCADADRWMDWSATTLQRELQLDNPSVSLEQTMVAMQKAQLGFQATLQVRNRLVQAYSEIMNMQV